MTPEATYSALHLIDRWRLTVAALLGEPLPPLPAVPGRVHRAPPVSDRDPRADAWDAEQQIQPGWKGWRP